MSSIYRKGGWDGFYYYQTYVYNTETGKKDKRIFHSLGTKELAEAETKQAELDIKYEQQEQMGQTKSRFTFLSQYRQTIALVVGTAMFTVLIMNLFQTEPAPQKTLKKQVVTPAAIPEEVLVQSLVEETAPDPTQHVTKEESPPIVSKPVPEPKLVEPKLTIPKHTVERVESISSVFKQGKVYVTVDEEASTERLRLLCKNITKQYPEFSNIVICLYASSAIGIELAKGTETNFSVKEQKKAWLVLYSYNPVEGDYFDNEPGEYLGS